MNTVAVLLTVFNRVNITLECLSVLQNKDIEGVVFDIFLVDDGSTDGTFEIISKKFPEVNLLKGNGNLFWNNGMRLAWNSAIERSTYDFFLWLNNDTFILEGGLETLFEDYKRLKKIEQKPFLITGACKKINSEEFSYGGRNDNGAIIPNGEFQECKYINGNIVLVPYNVYKIIGVLSDKFTHAMGDFDYGLRAAEQNIKSFTTSSYIAMCDINPISGWKDPKLPLTKRWKLFRSPKGLNIKEFMYFTKRHNNYIKTGMMFIKVHLQLFFPNFYNKLKNK
jgi:GT2 family glycosyltransferase